MTTILHITEILLGALMLVLSLIMIGWVFLFLCDTILSKHFERGQQAQWEKDQRHLQEVSRWFSEDEVTQNLIRRLAESGDASAIRSAWRQDKDQLNKTPS